MINCIKASLQLRARRDGAPRQPTHPVGRRSRHTDPKLKSNGNEGKARNGPRSAPYALRRLNFRQLEPLPNADGDADSRSDHERLGTLLIDEGRQLAP
jgi:hypothetical protein